MGPPTAASAVTNVRSVPRVDEPRRTNDVADTEAVLLNIRTVHDVGPALTVLREQVSSDTERRRARTLR
jgi:hypothetical protein